MSAEKSNAIVLRVTEFSETSCIGSFFTRDFGKLTLIAKGARRPKSPFEAALDVLAVCRIVFLHKSSSMGTLTEAKLERRFRNRKKDLDWLYAAYYVVELLKTLVEEGDPHPEIFDLAVSTLEQIDGGLPVPAEEAAVRNDSVEMSSTKNFELNRCLLRFEVGLLKHLGHFPSLDQCVGCGRLRTTDNSVTFGLNNGGVLCPKCWPSQKNLMQVSAAGIQCLDELREELDRTEDVLAEESEMDWNKNFRFLREPLTTYPQDERKMELSNEASPSIASVKGETPWGEVRKLMNQYVAILIGHEPRVVRFLAKLSQLESQ